MKIQLSGAILILTTSVACQTPPASGDTAAPPESPSPLPATPAAAAAPVFNPPTDPSNIVNIAIGSKDHTTLVTALKAADYATSISNPGPFTVFAPTNAAFDKLPPGTVEALVKPEKQADLKEILKYHVAVSVYQARDFKDGQTLGMANGGKVTFHVKGGKVMVNDATIIASIPASNGIVHVIDGVLLPPPKT
jgi:uncharacterized surface protein with fasciclin (FAS1) repeats